MEYRNTWFDAVIVWGVGSTVAAALVYSAYVILGAQ
jgi:hypothetical protein